MSSVKSTRAGDDIVAAASGYGSFSAAVENGDGIVSTTSKVYGSVASAAGYGIVADYARDGSEVGYMGVSGGLGTRADGFLRLYPLFLTLIFSHFYYGYFI